MSWLRRVTVTATVVVLLGAIVFGSLVALSGDLVSPDLARMVYTGVSVGALIMGITLLSLRIEDRHAPHG